MKTVHIPTLDYTGQLSPMILDAIEEHGAIAGLDPADPHNTLVMTFQTDAAAKAFSAKVDKIASHAKGEAKASFKHSAKVAADEASDAP